MANANSLHAAARNGDLAQLGKCLSENFDVNATDKHQRTALHLAAWAGHSDVAKALLSTPGIRTKACAMDQMTALHFGAMNGHTEVCRLLLNAGIPVNTKTRKALTPLHFACQKGHEETVQMLLKRNAAPYLKDSKGENALDKCKNSEACRAAVQAAMDAAAAASAFSKKRGRKEGEDGDDGKAEHDVGGGKNRIKGGDSSGDDDEEEDIIPLKRPLIAPRPAPKQPQRPQASGGALPSGRVETLARTAAAAAAGQNEAATAATPASHGKTDSAKPLQEGCEQRATGCNIPVTIPPVAKPPVAAPMRPPVARGPSRDVQSGKDGT